MRVHRWLIVGVAAVLPSACGGILDSDTVPVEGNEAGAESGPAEGGASDVVVDASSDVPVDAPTPTACPAPQLVVNWDDKPQVLFTNEGSPPEIVNEPGRGNFARFTTTYGEPAAPPTIASALRARPSARSASLRACASRHRRRSAFSPR